MSAKACHAAQVTIRGVNVWGDPRVPNNDGIDIDSSSDVLITRTNVSTLDDAICVKSNDSEPHDCHACCFSHPTLLAVLPALHERWCDLHLLIASPKYGAAPQTILRPDHIDNTIKSLIDCAQRPGPCRTCWWRIAM